MTNQPNKASESSESSEYSESSESSEYSERSSEKPRVLNRTILWWEWAAVALCVLPAFAWLPQLIDAAGRAAGELRALVFFFPCYAVCSGILAVVCFKSRPVLGWIITVLLALSDLAVAYLWNAAI